MTEAIQFVRRRWWLLALGVLAAAIPTLIVSSRLPRVYEARATLVVAPDVGIDLTGSLSPDELTATYASIVKSQPILDAVANQVGLTSNQVDNSLNVLPIQNTRLLQLFVRAQSPQQAADLANVVAATAVDQVQKERANRLSGRVERLTALVGGLGQDVLTRGSEVQALTGQSASPEQATALLAAQGALAQAQQHYQDAVTTLDRLRIAQAGGGQILSISEAALPPVAPVLPSTLADVFAAVVVGLTMATLLGLLLDRLLDPLPPAEDWARLTDLPLLGETGTLATLGTLRHVLLVTSGTEREGKTVLATELANQYAKAGEQVILVDANLRHPALAERLSVRASRGLSDLLAHDDIDAASVITPTNVPNVRAVSAGNVTAESADLLAASRLPVRVLEVGALADVVILDGPALVYSEALVMATRVDGVICVVDSQQTAQSVQHTVEQLRAAGAPILGFVLNRRTATRITAGPEAAPMVERAAQQSQSGT